MPEVLTKIDLKSQLRTPVFNVDVVPQGPPGAQGPQGPPPTKKIFTADGTGIYALGDTIIAGSDMVFVGGSCSTDYIVVGGNSIHEFVPSPIGTIVVVTYFI